MASAMGSPIKVDVMICCQCGGKIPVENWENKEHKSLHCIDCGTSIDMSIHFHTYYHGVCQCDKLVKLGIAEATRECDKTCKGGKCG